MVKNIDRDEFVKRTKEGQQRAIAAGKSSGRPGVQSGLKGRLMVTDEQIASVKALRAQGMTLMKISEAVGLSRPTVTKVLHAHD